MAAGRLLHRRHSGHLQRQHLQRPRQPDRLYGHRLESDHHVTVDVGLERLLEFFVWFFVGFVELLRLFKLFELVRFIGFLLGLFRRHLLCGLEFDRRLHRRWDGQCRYENKEKRKNKNKKLNVRI